MGNTDSSRDEASSYLQRVNPLKIIRDAQKAVPAVKYALAVAAVAFCGSFVTLALGQTRTSIIVAGGTFIAMFLMLTFANVSRSRSPAIFFAGLLLVWATTLFFIAFLALTISAFTIEKPRAWSDFLGLSAEAVPSSMDVVEKTRASLKEWLCSNLTPRLSEDALFASFPLQQLPETKKFNRLNTNGNEHVAIAESDDYQISLVTTKTSESTYKENIPSSDDKKPPIDTIHEHLLLVEHDTAYPRLLDTAENRLKLVTMFGNLNNFNMIPTAYTTSLNNNPFDSMAVSSYRDREFVVGWSSRDRLRHFKFMCDSKRL